MSIMYHLEQGQSYVSEKQTSLEDRYYNNQSFQEEFPVNDPEINNAATKIQAKFRGHKARQGVDKLKQENKQTVDTDQQDLGYLREQSATPNKDENQVQYDEDQKSSPLPSPRVQQQETKTDVVAQPEEQAFEEELTEEEKQEQERAARSIQAKFRGFQNRKSATRDQESPVSTERSAPPSRRQQQQESENGKTPTPPSTRLSGKIDSDRQDFGGNLTANDQIQDSEDDDTDRPRLEREPTQLSEDFERHTQVPRDSDFEQEERPDINNDEDDMNDPNLDKAATRIQASYRGYKARKGLGSPSSRHSNPDQDQDQRPSSTSPHAHDEYDSARSKKVLSPSADGNKEPEVEEDDTTAAVKIQAAYRGYRTRKDLEK